MIVAVKAQQCLICVLLTYVLLLMVILVSGTFVTVVSQ